MVAHLVAPVVLVVPEVLEVVRQGEVVQAEISNGHLVAKVGAVAPVKSFSRWGCRATPRWTQRFPRASLSSNVVHLLRYSARNLTGPQPT